MEKPVETAGGGPQPVDDYHLGFAQIDELRKKARMFDDIIRTFAARTNSKLSELGAPLPGVTLYFATRGAAAELRDALAAAETVCR